MSKNILHVVSVSFSLPYFVGEQFVHFKKSNPDYNFYVACSLSENFSKLSDKLEFIEVPLVVNRSISPIEDLKSILELRKFILENKIDIVVGHTPKGGMIAMIASFLAGVKKRIYFRHGIMFETSQGFKRLLLKNIERMTGFFATQVVCVSNEIKSISEVEHLSSKKKNILLGRGTCNGVDCNNKYNPINISKDAQKALREKHNINEGEFVLGYVGRLVKDKGINELVEAWKVVSMNYSNVKLLLVGPFEERDPVEEKVKEYILNEESVVYTDFVEDASAYYSLMSAFILPSYREGFPTVVLEASSMELPVLTTRATGCSESIIENETGIFIELNADSIANGIDYIIKNPILAKEIGENGRAFIKKNFEQTKVWNIIENKLLK